MVCVYHLYVLNLKKKIAQELDNHSQKRNKTKIFRFISMCKDIEVFNEVKIYLQ